MGPSEEELKLERERERQEEMKRKVKEACVVFIAPTQHGKSTTIDKFHEAMGGKKPSDMQPNFVLGNGTTSASRVTIMLDPLPVSYLEYADWPSTNGEGEEFANKKRVISEKYNAAPDKGNLGKALCDELYSLRHEDMLQGGDEYIANVKAGPRAVVELKDEDYNLQLRIIDTPGLDDSEGRGVDDIIIEGLLDVLSEKAPDLSAFIFVVKAGMAWSGSFLVSAKRYWDQFPSFRENWIFVHTNMDPFAEDFGNSECYEESCERRKRDLVEALSNAFDQSPGTLTRLPHIFVENIGTMDSKRKVYRKKAEFQHMERAKAFNRLITAICSNSLKPLMSLDYRKSSDNETLDAAMMQLFEQRKNGVSSTLAPLKEVYGKKIDKMVAVSESRTDLKFKVKDTKENLAKYDVDDKIKKAETTAFEEWTFWGSRAKTYKLDVPYIKNMCEKKIQKNAGYKHGKHEVKSFDYSVKDRKTKLEVACSSSWMRGYEFVVKIMVSSKEVYKNEIAQYKTDLMVEESKLENVEREYEELKLENSTVANEIDIADKQIQFFGECAYLSNKKTVELGIWKKLSPFYAWAQSADGQAVFRDPAFSHQIIDKFCEVHGLTERYKEAVKS